MTNRSKQIQYRKGNFPVLIFFLLFLTFYTSCKKDKDLEIECNSCDCQPIPPSPSEWGYSFLVGGFDIQNTSFNPNNDNELVYSVKNYSENSFGIFKYDLTTQESVQIYDGDSNYNVDWGINDWVIFTSTEGYIWKVKSNGDDLTQLTFLGGASSAQWNSTADSIVFRKSWENISVVIDENGIGLDTLSDFFSALGQAWNHPKYISGISLGSLTLKSIKDSSLTNIRNLSNDLSIYNGCEEEVIGTGGVVWENDNIYYSHSLGVFKSDINGIQPSLIKESCSTKRYTSPSINKSKNKLLFVRWDQKIVGEAENTLLTTKELVTMNLDGSDETILEVE